MKYSGDDTAREMIGELKDLYGENKYYADRQGEWAASVNAWHGEVTALEKLLKELAEANPEAATSNIFVSLESGLEDLRQRITND